MTWPDVAKKEFRDAVRARSLWAVAAVFAVFMVATTYVHAFVFAATPEVEQTGTSFVSGVLGQGSAFVAALVALLGLLVGYATVVDERDSGSIKFLLGLPHSRLDVVLGKVVGRSAVLVAAFAVGFVASAAFLVTYDSPDFGVYLGFVALTSFLGVSFVSTGVGISSSITSRRRVTAVTFALLFLLVFWDTGAGPAIVVYALTGEFGPSVWWYDYLAAVFPNVAYANVGALLVGAEFDRLSAYSFAALVTWTVVPAAVGYLRFRNADV